MKTPTTIFAALALVAALAGPAAAQQKSPAPAAAKPAIESKAHGDWMVECMKRPDGKKICQMFQQIVEEDKKTKKKHVQLIVKTAIINIKGKDGKTAPRTRMMLLAPLGTLLTAKLGITLDSEKQVFAPFLVCEQGCMVDLALEGDLLEKIRKGKKMQVSYKRMNNKQVSASVSLNGFNAALQALSANRVQ